MAGHSKWKQIKHKKGAADAKRGQLFTKLSREITVSAREGGGDPGGNFRLRLAIQKARDSNMPLDNVERAIKRGTGEGADRVEFVELAYEGYSPGGAAIYVQALSDNRNRTAADVRRVFARGGGSLGEAGSVAWNFESKGVILAEIAGGEGEKLALAAIDVGAEDVKADDTTLEVFTEAEALEQVRQALEGEGVTVASAELQLVPKTPLPLDAGVATQTLRLLDSLEELDDVQKVYTNADFPEAALAGFQE